MKADIIDRRVESEHRALEYFSEIRGTGVCNFGIFSFYISVFLSRFFLSFLFFQVPRYLLGFIF